VFAVISQFGVVRGGDVEFNAGVVGAEVDTHGLPAEPGRGDGRQQVLGGVLLHVVMTTYRVDFAMGRAERKRRLEDVHDAITFVDHVDHTNAVERSGIVRLTARRGIERAAIEHHVPGIGAVRDDDGVEAAHGSIVVVEPLGHVGRTGLPT